MHPIERLRYVARVGGVDQGELVREAAAALSGLSADPGGLIMSCRRLLARHPTAGALWFLCARLLTAGDIRAEAWKATEELVPLDLVDRAVGPDGGRAGSDLATRADCAAVPELLERQ